MGKKSAKSKEAGKEKLFGAEGFEQYYGQLYGDRWQALKESFAGEGSAVEYKIPGSQQSYFLDSASVLAALCLPLENAENLLDLCAAPGGKTTQLAQAVQGAGLLVSNDISVSRSKALIKNIELFGLKNTVVTCERPDRLAGSFPDYFDAILVDAPCSGEGMFRQGPRMWRAWEEHGPGYFSPIQKGIVESAAGMLKPGGYMIYSTCTFDPREDEQVIAHLLLIS